MGGSRTVVRTQALGGSGERGDGEECGIRISNGTKTFASAAFLGLSGSVLVFQALWGLSGDLLGALLVLACARRYHCR